MPRPRVLLVVTHLDPGGAQETVILLAEGLPAEGYDVTVAARPGAEEGRVRAAGAEVLRLEHLFRPVSPRRDALAYRELRRLLRRGFDVVHTHSSKAGVLGRVAARRAGVPAIVHTSHGLPVTPDMGRATRTILVTAERAASRSCDSVVAVSRATARELTELRIARPEHVVVIPSGVDVARFADAMDRAEAKKALGIDPAAPVAGWIGRHFDQKRPEQVVAAARRIVSEVPGAVFVMAGDGPLLEQSRAAAAGEPRIRILGHRGDIETVYAALDVMLLASAWEGLPRTVLEAHAAGVPVVSTDVSGIGEVVAEGVTGYLARSGDWPTLADRAVTILRDPALRAGMARAARAQVDDFYSTAYTTRATAELYESILSRKTSRSRR
ncbi:MAG: glycosyltransferase family 4 protein [Actinomycetota bacterium]|nr:glycosyltransferase family 4 protein [Actinomycetota bacterium]